MGVYRIDGSLCPSNRSGSLDVLGGVNSRRLEDRILYTDTIRGRRYSETVIPGLMGLVVPTNDDGRMIFSSQQIFVSQSIVSERCVAVFRPNLNVFSSYTKISGSIRFHNQYNGGSGSLSYVALYVGNHGLPYLDFTYIGNRASGSWPGEDVTIQVPTSTPSSYTFFSEDFEVTNTFNGYTPIIVTVRGDISLEMSDLTITIFGAN